ncbi:MAG: lytic transglycosylase domain-containing protein, partial [Janthinobacterium lividum]
MRGRVAGPRHWDILSLRRAFHLPVAVLLLGGLAACAGQPSSTGLSVVQEANEYRAHEKRSYPVPGPVGDPWGPYIVEASTRFDVPQSWIRGVIHQESSGRQDALSAPGAMGLMQIMAPTYDELRTKLALGDDPYNPHDNILAGTAYIRQLYELYGTPAFLAAYDAGMGRLDDYLTHDRPLPNETRRYVASVGPRIAGDFPRSRSGVDLLVASSQRPPSTRPHSGEVVFASGGEHPGSRSGTRFAAAASSAAEPVRLAARITQPADGEWNSSVAEAPAAGETNMSVADRRKAASTAAASYSRSRLHLLPVAMAASLHVSPDVHDHAWGVQVGAYASPSLADAAAASAR